MAKVIVGMTISLDGFVADQNGNAGRLYPDLAALRQFIEQDRHSTGVNKFLVLRLQASRKRLPKSRKIVFVDDRDSRIHPCRHGRPFCPR